MSSIIDLISSLETFNSITTPLAALPSAVATPSLTASFTELMQNSFGNANFLETNPGFILQSQTPIVILNAESFISFVKATANVFQKVKNISDETYTNAKSILKSIHMLHITTLTSISCDFFQNDGNSLRNTSYLMMASIALTVCGIFVLLRGKQQQKQENQINEDLSNKLNQLSYIPHTMTFLGLVGIACATANVYRISQACFNANAQFGKAYSNYVALFS